MRIWLWDAVALHYSAPPPPGVKSWHPVKTVTHLKTNFIEKI